MPDSGDSNRAMDPALEAAIDKVGRDRVFAHARALGWRPTDDPPKCVWWGIVNHLRYVPAPPAPEDR